MRQQNIILGPPGCGKTTYLLNLVDQELSRGLSPSRIGYFSFTRKATTEAIDRACEKFGKTKNDFPYFRTLHSLAFQELGLSKDQVLGPKEYKAIGESLGLVFSDYMDFEEGMPLSAKSGDQVLYLTGISRARMMGLEEQWRTSQHVDVNWFQLKQFADTLKAYKADTSMLDFSDMLDNYVFHCNPLDIDVAFIDEAQDLSKQQWHMVMHAIRNAKKVYIAGDDDQAIYRWSGADVDSFLSLKGSRLVLDQSFRLPQAVHSLCSKIAGKIKHRFPKQWKPREEKGSVGYIASLEHVEWKEGSYLFLGRNKYLLKGIEQFMRTSGIPYTVGNRSSIDPAKVEAIVIWEKLRRGDEIRVADVRKVYAYMRSGEGVKRGFKQLKEHADDSMVTLGYLRESGGLLVDSVWHEALSAISAEELEFYVAAKRRGEKLTRKPRVHLSSIHAVKGGEADHVVLLSDMAYKTYAEYQRDPDDEHRVAYVGASRARRSLTILMPQTPRAYEYA